MRSRDVFLALLIIGAGLIVTGYHRGAFAPAPWCWVQWDGRWLEPEADWTHAGWRQADHSSQSIALEGATALTIHNPNGRTTILTGTDNAVHVEVARYGRRGSEEEVASRARQAQVKITRPDGAIEIAVTGPEGFEREARVDLRITAPGRLAAGVGG